MDSKIFALFMVLLIGAGMIAALMGNFWLCAVLYAFPAGVTLGNALYKLVKE